MKRGGMADEGPQHRVMIRRPFAVGKYEVTFEEWDACVSAGGCGHRPGDAGWGRGRRPVINVSWEDARQYVGWLSEEAGFEYRLLSESEWEYAARAGTNTAYHFGSSESQLCRYANHADRSLGVGAAGRTRCSDGVGAGTAPVGSFSANGWDLYDMLGNVFEWVQDCWNGSYNGGPSDGSVWQSDECSHRVVRGGSWLSPPQNLRSAYRLGGLTDGRDFITGFRVARTLNP